MINSMKAGVALVALVAAMAGQSQEAAAQSEADTVFTVGHRRAERTTFDAPSPVSVVDAQDIAALPYRDMQDILRTASPSYNLTRFAMADAAMISRPASLRGLPPDYSLLLVNNKRWHRGSVITFLGVGVADGAHGPDISAIPGIALKQIEILRDGAAPIYGSDAVAGVINLVTKTSSSGNLFEVEFGQRYAGDGDRYVFAGNVGLDAPFVEGGFINLSMEFGEVDATERTWQLDEARELREAGNLHVRDPAVRFGQPNIDDDLKFFGAAAAPILSWLELYAFGNYAMREAENGFYFRNPTSREGVYGGPLVDRRTGMLDPAGVPSVLVGDLSGVDSGDCPAGIPLVNNGLIPKADILRDVTEDDNCFSWVEVYPGGFTPRFGADVEDRSALFGLRGVIPIGAGVDYDFSYSYGRNDVDFFITHTINASLGPDSPSEFNPGGYGEIDKAFNLDLTYDLATPLFASDVVIGLGAEHRGETFQVRAGNPASYEIGPLARPSEAYPAGQGFSSSSNGFGGFTPEIAGSSSQKNYAGFLTMETDVTDALLVQGAVRYEDYYETFGDALTYRVGARYAITEWARLRGGYGTGFHAPTAGQANVTTVSTTVENGELSDQGVLPLSSAAGQFVADRLEARTGHRPSLDASESRNFTIGAAMKLGGFRLSADFFWIDIDGRIAVSDQVDFREELVGFAEESDVAVPENATTSQLLNLLDQAGALDASDFAGAEDMARFGFFTNAYDSRATGVDIDLGTEFSLGPNSVTALSVALNWTDVKVSDRGLDGPAPVSRGRAKQIGESTPRSQGTMTLSHQDGPFRGLVRLNYYGRSYECHFHAYDDDAEDGCAMPMTIPRQVTFDLEASAVVRDAIEVVMGVENALSGYPEPNPYRGMTGSPYPLTAPAGAEGGYYYMKLRTSF